MTSEALISEAASRATYVGAATATIFGLSPGEWQVIGVIGGFLVGVFGLAVNFYFKWQHMKIAKVRAAQGVIWDPDVSGK
jgi:ABC-type Mn2+/Zn2+ transport system permease subunit